MNRPLRLVPLVVLFAGCDAVGGGRVDRQPSVLAPETPFEVTFSVPDTVRARQSVPVTVVTLGGGCVAFGDTEVAFRGTSVDIRPYDLFYTPGQGEGCTADLAYLPHTVQLTFDTPGMTTVRAFGRTTGDGSPAETVVEQPVVVTE